MGEVMTARAAAKLIRPGTVKTTHFLFVARTVEGDPAPSGWLRVPKVEAKRLLRDLSPGATVRVIVKLRTASVYITGDAP